jgi:hypothetical protein
MTTDARTQNLVPTVACFDDFMLHRLGRDKFIGDISTVIWSD